jgi:TalC/MipB family fructose-6-phosphate aldolase
MALYIDCAYLAEIEELATIYPLAGVTTNPSILLAAAGRGQRLGDLEVLRGLLGICAGPVFMQPTADTHKGLRAAAARYVEVDPARVVLKLAANTEGLRLALELAPQGVRLAFTACYALPQAYCGALAGAEWIIPYFGRLRRTGADACQRMQQMAALLARQQCTTRILAASLKSPADVIEVTLAGVQDVTAPPDVIRALIAEPLTDAAMSQFAADWERYQRELSAQQA